LATNTPHALSGGREGITLVSQQETNAGSIRKHFMWRFGNLIVGKQVWQGMRYATRTATLITMTTVIWSVYRLSNIVQCMRSRMLKNKRRTLKEYANWLRNGTSRKKDENGIANTRGWLLRTPNIKNIPVNVAVRNLKAKRHRDTAPLYVDINIAPRKGVTMWFRNVLSVVSYLKQPSPFTPDASPRPAVENVEVHWQNKTDLRPVYNLTVDKDHLYYANGLLVSNCDSMSMALSRFMCVHEQEKKYNLPADLPDDLRRDLLADPRALEHWLSEHGEEE